MINQQLQRCAVPARLNARRVRMLSAAATAQPTPVTARYEVTETMKEAFKRDGFVHLVQVLTENEIDTYVAPLYQQVIASAAVNEEEPVISIVRPKESYPQWTQKLLEERCYDIACQLLDVELDEVELDFDQILAKKPKSRDSGVAWHQDAAYWPPELAAYDCATANMWVAVSDVPMESGCMRYVPGSHLEEGLRPHEPVATDPTTDSSDATPLRAMVGAESARMVPMKRGDIVIHREKVVHGSGPNMTDKWRNGYILNFKRTSCVVEEHALGYTPYQPTTAHTA